MLKTLEQIAIIAIAALFWTLPFISFTGWLWFLLGIGIGIYLSGRWETITPILNKWIEKARKRINR